VPDVNVVLATCYGASNRPAFGLPNNLISHHLKVLREAGLIEASRSATDARWIHYSINKESLGRARARIAALLDSSRVKQRCPGECRPVAFVDATQPAAVD